MYVKYIVGNDNIQCNLFVMETIATNGAVVLFHAINVYFVVAFKLHSFLTFILCDQH
jgi:hypothetical protein